MPQFIVADMTCGHCASTITKALKIEDPTRSPDASRKRSLPRPAAMAA